MRQRASQLLFGLAIGAATLTVTAAGWQQGPYPAHQTDVEVTSGSLCPGYRVTVVTDGFAPGARVTLSADGEVLAVLSANAAGVVRTTVTVPAGADGPLVVKGAAAGGGTTIGTKSFRCPANASVEEVLPFTGAPLATVAAAGATALLGGGVTVAVLRRRRRS